MGRIFNVRRAAHGVLLLLAGVGFGTLISGGRGEAASSINHRVAVLETAVRALQGQSAEQANQIAALDSRISALESRLQHFSRTGNDVFITGANLHILNGQGRTDTVNGLGNLIVGYDEPRAQGADQSGSHNLVVGTEHNYSSYGGIVAGIYNAISGQWACVTGGTASQATGYASSVSGGSGGTASGGNSAVGGGLQNTASGDFASVVGGKSNTASGVYAWVGAGYENFASGDAASVSGGQQNLAEGERSSVSAGVANLAHAGYASVSGGINNIAFNSTSTVSGGQGVLEMGLSGWAAGGVYPLDQNGNVVGPGAYHAP